MKKELITLDEETDKEALDKAQDWCDIGRKEGRNIYVIHKGTKHVVCEEGADAPSKYAKRCIQLEPTTEEFTRGLEG